MESYWSYYWFIYSTVFSFFPVMFFFLFKFQEAAEELVPRLDVILQHLMCAFGKYQVHCAPPLNVLYSSYVVIG